MIKRTLILIILLCTITTFLYSCINAAFSNDNFPDNANDGGQTAETPEGSTTEETPGKEVEDAESGLIFTLLDNGTYSVRGMNQCIVDGKVVIPDTYNGKTVTVIETSAFNFYDNITEIVMPDSIISIESVAFAGCTNLKTIRLSSNISEIPVGCFADCKSLETIALPDGLTKLCDSAFINCYRLTTLEIPKSVSVIENYVFSGCLELENLIIPDGVTGIGIQCFYKCYSLREITIPASVKGIGHKAFYAAELETVYYSGSEEQWKKIYIGDYNEELTSANIQYNGQK